MWTAACHSIALTHISSFKYKITETYCLYCKNTLQVHTKHKYSFCTWQMIGVLTLTLTVPDSLSISPSRADSSDDFPDPTTPTTATSDPSSTSRLMLKEEKMTMTRVWRGIQNTQEIKRTCLNWTEQDKTCTFLRKSSSSSYVQHKNTKTTNQFNLSCVS